MADKANGNLADKAEQVAEEAGKSAAEIGRELHHHAENAKSDMVKTLYEAAKLLRKQTRDAGANKDVLERVDDVATGFEKAATYLKRNSYGAMGEDAVRTVKTYPLQTMAVIFVVGVLIGLLLRGGHAEDDRPAKGEYRNGSR
jgi:ElaB/YqjD/DUF883 family membrane-anchored ribosome-binding protein